MITVSQASQITSIPRSTLKTAAQEGRIPASRPGHDWLIDEHAKEWKEYVRLYKPRKKKIWKES